MRTSLLFIAFLFSLTFSFGQQDLNKKLPFDSKVVTGKLENGLTYYIRPNAKPEKKVELRLVINAGSILEDDDQQGLAHMAEHMAFNGTKNFEKNEIISYLQSIGVTFGNDLNAYTSFDETVYILPIPTTDPKNLETGFQILEDWAHQVSYRTEDINNERNVILEESRLGKGAGERMSRQILPSLLSGSRYANRLPIGKDSLIQSFDPNAIRRFYKDWYRPNLMAVVVVGDITVAQAESMIRKHFSQMKNPENVRPRTVTRIPAYPAQKSIVVTDKEATSYSVELHYSPFDMEATTTVNAYRNDLMRNILVGLLNQRFEEVSQQANAPFIYAFAYFQNYGRENDQFNAGAGCEAAGATKALEALATEIERAKRFGFLPSELERAKKGILAGIERSYNERDKTESSRYADEYIRHFLQKEPSPGIEQEYAYYKELVPGITVQELNAMAKKLSETDDNFLVTLMGPEPDANTKLPTEPALLAAAKKAMSNKDIAGYEETAVAENLLAAMPKPGSIVGTTTNAVMGTTTWTLSNGATVVIKKTDFKNDQILMGARRPGGTDKLPITDKYSAQYATAVVGEMGYGSFTPTDLQKALTGKVASVSPQISGSSEGWTGSSSVKDVETMLQLLHLQATSPRMDKDLFASYLQKNKAQLAFLGANPQIAFIDSFYTVLYNNDDRRPAAVPKASHFDAVDMNRAVAIYMERLGNVSNTQFVFVGSVDEASLRPLVEIYIASLPGSNAKTTAAWSGLKPVTGQKEMTFYKGKDPKSLVLAIYNGETAYSADLALAASAVSEILNIRIIEELREKIQGIYTGGTNAAVQSFPYGSYTFVFQLPCGPDKVDTLLLAMNKEIADIKANGPREADLQKVKQQWLERRKESVKENGTWRNELLAEYFPGTSTQQDFLSYEARVQALTAKQVQDAANIVLQDKNKLVAILMPEKKE